MNTLQRLFLEFPGVKWDKKSLVSNKLLTKDFIIKTRKLSGKRRIYKFFILNPNATIEDIKEIAEKFTYSESDIYLINKFILQGRFSFSEIVKIIGLDNYIKHKDKFKQIPYSENSDPFCQFHEYIYGSCNPYQIDDAFENIPWNKLKEYKGLTPNKFILSNKSITLDMINTHEYLTFDKKDYKFLSKNPNITLKFVRENLISFTGKSDWIHLSRNYAFSLEEIYETIDEFPWSFSILLKRLDLTSSFINRIHSKVIIFALSNLIYNPSVSIKELTNCGMHINNLTFHPRLSYDDIKSVCHDWTSQWMHISQHEFELDSNYIKMLEFKKKRLDLINKYENELSNFVIEVLSRIIVSYLYFSYDEELDTEIFSKKY